MELTQEPDKHPDYSMSNRPTEQNFDNNSLPAAMNIESLIYLVRDEQVMLDSDLARLYGVETKVLNQAVKRNIRRFPADFMFQLTREVTNCDLKRKKRRHEIYAVCVYGKWCSHA